MAEEKKKSKEKSEEQILFPEAKVGDITIKPWSFYKLFELSPLLDRVLDKMEEKGIDLEKYGDILPYGTVARLFTIAAPEVKEIFHITLDKTEEDLKDLSMEDGIKIATIIYLQNKETVKNALAPLLGKKKAGRGVR